MTCGTQYKAAIFVNGVVDHRFLAALEQQHHSILFVTSQPMIMKNISAYGFDVFFLDLNAEINCEFAEEVRAEKIIIFENNCVESGLAIDFFNRHTVAPIVVVKRPRRFMPLIYHRTLGAAFVIYTNDDTKVSFLLAE
ncbi:hypothetical protein SAMN05421736_101452 [Evansella caseinilytica]|uniref:Uncharacterized protein n=1 Tax=Evansella caseinilytica TaxID=1503961 RepID=A0A1H3HCB3_9BACI|nr:hypothetical protein [Evansella caseinilytica]SDY13097.1 hypothetical protein SAMN05421736_101452 [Evansella caseinilytica]